MITDGQFVELISSIYEAAADIGLWPTALCLIADACRTSKTVLTRQGNGTGVSWNIAPQCESSYNESYARYYHFVNPLLPRVVFEPVGTVQTDDMIIPKSELIRTEFYTDFLVPQGVGSMVSTVVHVEGGLTTISAHRRRVFEAEDIQLFERLTPHLQRAVEINIKFAKLQMNSDTSIEALNQLEQGVVLIDKDGGVVFANHEAERLFATGVLRIANGNIVTHSVAKTRQLHALIAGCAQHSVEVDAHYTFSLAREGGQAPLSLQVMPLRTKSDSGFLGVRSMAIIFVTDPDRKPVLPISQIAKQFGLTPAEAAFAREILIGDGLQAAADRLKVTRATARTHLAHIFAKTGTRRQAELVHLLLQRHHGDGQERE